MILFEIKKKLDHWEFFETHTNQLFVSIAIINRLFVIASAIQELLVDPE
jgi:hypothetical protein